MSEELPVWAHRLARQPGTYLSIRNPITRSILAQWHVDIEDDAALPQMAQNFLILAEARYGS